MALGLQRWVLPIRQIVEHRIPCGMSPERIDNCGQRIRQDIRKLAFLRRSWQEGQAFHGRTKLRVHADLVAAGVDAIPAEIRQMNGIQSVQRERRPRIANAESLVTKAGGDAVSTEERCE